MMAYRKIGTVAAALLLAPGLAGCASAPRPTSASASIETEARAFMTRYEAALRSHDREAIASLYHPDGTWFVLNGRRGFETFEKVRAGYLKEWRGPAGFSWRDLTYEVAGSDSVIVLGGFDWGAPPDVRAFSYVGLLKRVDGQLRIRVEDETPVPAPKK